MNISQRLANIEANLATTGEPLLGKYPSIIIEGETTPQAVADTYNAEQGTTYPLDAFRITSIVFTDKPEATN